MLYITTRENKDAFTAARTLTQNQAQDGGLFVPFRMPVFTQEEIASLKEKSFGQAVAQILNCFFSARLTGWDVDFSIGRNPVKLFTMNHRMVIGELWHNPGARYSYIVQKLYDRILLRNEPAGEPTEWVAIAVRIAVLFGLFGELMRMDIADCSRPVDLAVPADDFSLPMACWYACRMGLPIGTIICGCNADNGLWDLVRRGEYNPNQAVQKADIALERLIQGTLGCREVRRYRERCDAGRSYTVSEAVFFELCRGLYVAVVGKLRIQSIVNSVRKTNGYLLAPAAALAYGALQDYRASVTEGRVSLLLADYQPTEA